MPTIPIYQIDAFTDEIFRGNPAAVCPLEAWLPEPVMQAIAAENNLAETAFFVPEADGYALRWFTPTVEVDLCGHATLASAHVIFDRLDPGAERVRFSSRGGDLVVTRDGGLLVLDFPSIPASPAAAPPALIDGLGAEPREVARADHYLAVFDGEAEIAALDPGMAALATLHPHGVIATAPGDIVDFVSRFFAPSHGIPEDHVTGSAHCTLIPYWAARLEKTHLHARQISVRGGELFCEDRGERVGIGGHAAFYMEGTLSI